MPLDELILYQEKNGEVPLLTWLDSESSKVQIKAVATLNKLAQFGHQLRRPHADYLRDDIYELRFKDGRRNLRLLYFFAGRNIVVVSHGLAKEAVVPPKEIDLAITRRARFLKDPQVHRFGVQLQDMLQKPESTEGNDHEEEV